MVLGNSGEVDRVMRQMDAFNAVTVGCSHCGGPAALDVLQPTAHGLTCRRCLIEMPTAEFERLRLDNAAVESEFVV